MLNSVILLGRLTKTPEVKYTANAKVVCQFTIAVDDSYGENKTTSFIPIVVWGKVAEVCGNNLDKGHRVVINGRLQIRSYADKDGATRYATEVIANSVEFIERRGNNAQQQQSGGGFEGMGTAMNFEEPAF